jgi:hypothetical protein
VSTHVLWCHIQPAAYQTVLRALTEASSLGADRSHTLASRQCRPLAGTGTVPNCLSRAEGVIRKTLGEIDLVDVSHGSVGQAPHWPPALLREAQDDRMNVQVVCDLSGRLAWVSDPGRGVSPRQRGAAGLPVSWTPCRPRTGWATRGCIGNAMITPFRKAAARTSWTGRRIRPRSKGSDACSKVAIAKVKDLADPPHRLPQAARDIR